MTSSAGNIYAYAVCSHYQRIHAHQGVQGAQLQNTDQWIRQAIKGDASSIATLALPPAMHYSKVNILTADHALDELQYGW